MKLGAYWTRTGLRQHAPAVLAFIAAAIALTAGQLSAQEAEEPLPVPTFSGRGPALLMPVQSVAPLATGAWPGANRSHREARDAMTAELTFAFEEEEGAFDWKLPPQVIRGAERNPLLDVDPTRVAYQGLLEEPRDLKRYQLYEPLHSQLRMLAALFDTRNVALPIAVYVEPLEEEETALASSSTSASQLDQGRAVMRLALIDIRLSKILWYGEVKGDPAPVESSALFATLAARTAGWLIIN